MSDLVAMTKKDAPHPIAVPADSVAGHEGLGWVRAGDDEQADILAVALSVGGDAVYAEPEPVVMRAKDKSVPPTVVPAAAVAAYEAHGWSVAPKKLQADADQVAADAVPVPTTSQEG